MKNTRKVVPYEFSTPNQIKLGAKQERSNSLNGGQGDDRTDFHRESKVLVVLLILLFILLLGVSVLLWMSTESAPSSPAWARLQAW